LDTTSDSVPCAEYINFIQTTSALMQICRKIHDELAPRFYSYGYFEIAELSAVT
jgi:hypothetical protein